MFSQPRRPSARVIRLRSAIALPALALAVATALAACGSGTTPPPTAISADTAAGAMAVIQAHTPYFDGVGPKDLAAAGASAWWEATPLDSATPPSGWQVVITAGWGDCPSGCISRHVWTWQVSRAGAMTFQSETGPALPGDQSAALAAAATTAGVGGRVSASPVCPVVRPGQPGCDPRSVGGAVIVVKDGSGNEVARVTTDGSGLFRIPLAPGSYTLVPQPVQGLMDTAPPVQVTVEAGKLIPVTIGYDTGIR